MRKMLMMGMIFLQLMILVACGQSEKESVVMGRYIEQDLPVAGLVAYDGMCTQVQWQDGKVQIFLEQEDTSVQSYLQQEDSSFKEVPVEWGEAYIQMAKKQHLHIQKMAADSEGHLYLACMGYEEGYVSGKGSMDDDEAHTRSFILKVEADQIVQVTQIKVEGQPYVSFQNFMILDDETCIIGDYPLGICQFDLKTGQMMNQYMSADLGESICKDGKLYIISEKNKDMEVYDLKTQQLIKQVEGNQIDEDSCICEGDQGIYLVGTQGIWHLADNGDIWEQLMSQEGTSLGLPTSHIEAVYYDQGKFTVHMYKSGEGHVCKQYFYSETTPSKPEIELNAYMLEENRTFREGLVDYELAHPEVRINIQVGLGTSNVVSKQDAINALSTEVLAGKGPDLILLDGLDRERYIKRGVLANLDEVEGMESLIPQIRGSFKEEEGTFVVPLRFTTYALVGDENVIGACRNDSNTIESLAEYARTHTDTNVLADSSPEAVYRVAAPMILTSLEASKDKLDEEAIKMLLEAPKDLTPHFDESELKADYEYTNSSSVAMEEIYSLRQMIDKTARVQLRELSWEDNLLEISATLSYLGEKGFMLVAQDGKTCFNPKAMVGISQNTKQKKLAEDVLSMMMSEKLQQINTADGFPTREEAFDEWTSTSGKSGWVSRMMVGNMEFEIGWDDTCAIPLFKKELEKVQMPVAEENNMEDVILEAAKPYWNGDKELDEATEEIMPKLSLESMED